MEHWMHPIRLIFQNLINLHAPYQKHLHMTM